MKRVVTALFGAAIVFNLAPVGIAQQPDIYGTYRDCPFHCRTIRIKPNHTFAYRLNGDLYNDKRYKGTWKFVGRNKLKANSLVDRTPLKVIEKRGVGLDSYSVLVLDPNGALVPGAVISGLTDRRPFSVTTTDTGPIQIPKCREFKLALNHYRGRYRILNPKARQFVVLLYVDQIVNLAIDETWLIKGNRLYVAADDGTFDKNYWLDKLSSQEARKSFR